MTKQKSPPAESSNPNASRLRDNQRRSRARKKEYVATLEAKYQECQRMGVEASIEIQNAARAVVKENTRLKELLRKVGLMDDEIDKWILEGGLDRNAVERVQNGLGRRQCPSLESGLSCGGKPGSRAEMLARRSSTGGMLMKVNTPSAPPLPRRASIMPDNTGPSPLLASRTTVLQKTPSPLKTQLQLQTSLYPPQQGHSGYHTPSATATPTSTTSSPYSQTTPLPLTRSTMNASSAYNAQSPHQIAATTASAYASLTSSTTSPPILPGAVNGWNNFQIQPQLPPPALSPSVLNAFVAQHQQQRLHHQQQQYQQYAVQQQLNDPTRTPCNIASSIIQQFHPDGITHEIREELCPGRVHHSQSPVDNQQSSYSFQQHQHSHCQPRLSGERGLIDCCDNDEDDGNDGTGGSVNGYDSGDAISLNGMDNSGMDNSGMGLSGVATIDIGGGRGCGSSEGQGGSQDNLSGCSVDNVALFGMLSRMVG